MLALQAEPCLPQHRGQSVIETKLKYGAQRGSQCAVVVCSIVAFCLLFMLFLLIITCMSLSDKTRDRNSLKNPCKACDKFNGASYEQKQCCDSGDENIVSLVDSMFEKRKNEVKIQALQRIHSNNPDERSAISKHEALGFRTKNKVCGHLVGTEKQDVDSSNYRTYRWNLNHDRSYLKNGIDFKENKLVIPVGGVYYIYSQMHFWKQLGIQNVSRHQSEPFRHKIYRYNLMYPNTGDEMMLESGNTGTCSKSRGTSELSSYLGAALHLRTGDEIFVKIQGQGSSPFLPSMNIFGLYQL